MRRAYYSNSIAGFLDTSTDQILGELASRGEFALELTQRDAWVAQAEILRLALPPYRVAGVLFLEFVIPRLGRRIDAVVLIGPVVFVLEFKVGQTEFGAHAVDQVWDYALDLKNFHEPSHGLTIVPVLVATHAADVPADGGVWRSDDGVLRPLRANAGSVGGLIRHVLDAVGGPPIDAAAWEAGRYLPTPTIVEAATALYRGHSVAEISRSDASATNLTRTSAAVAYIIREARDRGRKAICFVTGVPGAGKTLVGLNVATQHVDKASDLYSVYLSGNGPLVAILQEALARDKVAREKAAGRKARKGEALSKVKMFVQNVHHFRDDCLVDQAAPPPEHVALFDEAQRAWTLEQTRDFMKRKKGRPGFEQSEPEFLISCLDRHRDWAVVVCLVGGGQEINTGEAGIGEWFAAVGRSFPHWHVHVSRRLTDSEYGAGAALSQLASLEHVSWNDDLHLAVSMRSFRAENVSLFVKQLLDLDDAAARRTLGQITDRYPIVVTRSLAEAKAWVRGRARGSERYGVVASSQAQRLKPHAIDVRSPMDPVHWFLDGKEDVRSSYYLEDVATEFHVQGLELDWACVAWDADFRRAGAGWENWSFCGDRWNRIKKPERKAYQKNAYRVLLTRARQGMAIVVPEGDRDDPTRAPAYYDSTFEYLRGLGVPLL
ncbi:MAG TPA: DUF2075 domain-containing protein [Humisphaera sp.]